MCFSGRFLFLLDENVVLILLEHPYERQEGEKLDSVEGFPVTLEWVHLLNFFVLRLVC